LTFEVWAEREIFERLLFEFEKLYVLLFADLLPIEFLTPSSDSTVDRVRNELSPPSCKLSKICEVVLFLS
jgi:hypothetical protein